MATPGHLFYLATTTNRNILKIYVLLRVHVVHSIVTMAGCCIFGMFSDDKLQQFTCAQGRLIITGHTTISSSVLATISLRVHFNTLFACVILINWGKKSEVLFHNISGQWKRIILQMCIFSKIFPRYFRMEHTNCILLLIHV